MPPSVAPPARVPRLDAALVPPQALGIAALTHLTYAGLAPAASLAQTHPEPGGAGALLDQATARRLAFQPEAAAVLEAQALARSSLFRISSEGGASAAYPHTHPSTSHPPATPTNPHPAAPPRLRLLALMGVGDVMANTALDFLTIPRDIQLDLLFIDPTRPLPPAMPDHDVAFCAAGLPSGPLLARLRALQAGWPRPMLNHPAAVARLTRDTVAQALGTLPGVLAPVVRRASREALDAHLSGTSSLPILATAQPVLLRPMGIGRPACRKLRRLDWPDDLAHALAETDAPAFYLTRFIDYRSTDGLYRKYRIVLIDNHPYLAHRVTGPHWMVQDPTAGLPPAADHLEAMTVFDQGFPHRHAAALARVAEALALDYAQLDCAETTDGRLLVFKASAATALIPRMDFPDPFAYEQAPMHRLFTAFAAMLARHAATVRNPAPVPG